jgi:uncharacterized protein (TIGR03437 family)
MDNVREEGRDRLLRAKARFSTRDALGLCLVLLGAPFARGQGVPPPLRWSAQYTPIYFDNFETATGSALGPGSGLVLSTGASVTTDPSLVISGKNSIRLTTNAILSTNPAVLQLPPLTTYIVEFRYHLLNYGTADNPVDVWFSSVAKGPLKIFAPSILKTASPSGTFSSGAQTWGAASATSYVLNISVNGGADIIIDDLTMFRQDAIQTSAAPGSKLAELPYPRLGVVLNGLAFSDVHGHSIASGMSAEQIENRVAFFDLVAAGQANTQTNAPDSIRRLRQLNPNAVFLPARDFQLEQLQSKNPVSSITSGPDDVFQRGVADAWYLRDTRGSYVSQVGYPNLFDMNISPYCPIVNGQTYLSYWLQWLSQSIFPSGVWDGVYTSTMLAAVDPLIPNTSDPALFDVDYQRTGTRDTMAWVSEMAKSAAIGTLQQLRNMVGGTQLVLADGDNVPHPSLAPYLNGIQLECMNRAWNNGTSPVYYQERWRKEFDVYQQIEATERNPRINLVEGCTLATSTSGTLTPVDYQNHRLTMGTALLGEGFYFFGNDQGGPPWWLDEYSVDSAGNAVEDRTKKGYLGQALSDATELTSPGKLELEQTFEGPSLPPSMGTYGGTPGASVYLTNKPDEVIEGTQSLVIDNPDHTRIGGIDAVYTLDLQPGTDPWLLTFDWRILETLDGTTLFGNFGVVLAGAWQGYYTGPEIVKGASGTAHIPIAPSSQTTAHPQVAFDVSRGGGKVVFDNIRVYRGGVGPWRRDFENGFVLVNPLQYAHTFSAAELAGMLNRTGIHRIKGTQAPDINNGQPVTGDLTLGPMDAIILLADRIAVSAPLITAVANAAGGQPGVAAGSFVSIYGSNFTLLPYDDWSKSIFSGQLPKELDGVRVTVGGKPAFINAVTPGQINVQAPDVGAGPVDVVVTTPGGVSASFSTTAQLYSPAFFPWPGNQPVATHADYSLAVKNGTFPGTTTIPAKPGEIITLWGTGFGPTNPPVPAGQEPTVQAPPTQSNVTATLGGVPVPVLGAVLSSYAATYQIAIQIPASMADGSYSLVASINGSQSPSSVLLAVQH